MSDMTEKICEYCGGSGVVQHEYMHYVTREMAIDAGDRSMEGMEMPETVIEQCQECQGTGFEIEAQND